MTDALGAGRGLRVRLVLALLALASAVPRAGTAQTVEAPASLQLVARIGVSGPSGDRIQTVRIGTKDLVQGWATDLGIEDLRYRLVRRRPIEDVEFDDTTYYLVVGSDAHYITDELSTPVEMPASFEGTALAVRARESDGTPTWFGREASIAFRMGAFGRDGTDLALVAFVADAGRLLVVEGSELGHALTGATWSVMGSLTDPVLGAGPFQGKLRLGREKVVEP